MNNEKFFKMMADSALDVEVFENRDGVVEYISPACERISGFSPQYFLTYPEEVFNLIHPEDREHLIDHVYRRRKMKDQGKYVTEFRILLANGIIKWMESYSRPIFSSSQEFEGYRISIRDITDRKKVELELEDYKNRLEEQVAERSKDLVRSQIFYETIVERSPNLICRWTADTTLTFVNSAYTKFQEISKENLIGLRWFELVNGDMKSFIGEKIRKTVNKGETSEYMEKYTHYNGDHFWIQWTDYPIYDKSGNIMEYQSIGNDVTHLEIARMQSEKAKENAEEGDRIKTAFLRNLSHELRTPLNGIIGFSELLNMGLGDDQIKEYSGIIYQLGKELQRIFERLFEITLLEAGQKKIFNSRFYLKKFSDELKEKIFKHPKVKTGQISFKVIDTFKEEELYTDQDILKQILTNLLENALKFTESGCVHLKYQKGDNCELMISIEDTGSGIEEGIRDLIFERFRQGNESITRQYGGLGTGLYLTRKLIELLGGRIWVESEINVGSIFKMTFPLQNNKKENGD